MLLATLRFLHVARLFIINQKANLLLGAINNTIRTNKDCAMVLEITATHVSVDQLTATLIIRNADVANLANSNQIN